MLFWIVHKLTGEIFISLLIYDIEVDKKLDLK